MISMSMGASPFPLTVAFWLVAAVVGVVRCTVLLCASGGGESPVISSFSVFCRLFMALQTARCDAGGLRRLFSFFLVEVALVGSVLVCSGSMFCFVIHHVCVEVCDSQSAQAMAAH